MPAAIDISSTTLISRRSSGCSLLRGMGRACTIRATASPPERSLKYWLRLPAKITAAVTRAHFQKVVVAAQSRKVPDGAEPRK